MNDSELPDWHPFRAMLELGFSKADITGAMNWAYGQWLKEHHLKDSKVNLEQFSRDLMEGWQPPK